MLATHRGRLEFSVAPLCGLRSMAVDGLRLVLVFGLLVGLGCFPLWALDVSVRSWLGLGAGHMLGVFMGQLAVYQHTLRLGTPAALSSLCSRAGLLS